MTVDEFGLSVVAGVVSWMLGLGVAALASRWVRAAIIGGFSRVVGIDVDYVYRNAVEAAQDIRKEIADSTRVRLLLGRGAELHRGTFDSAWDPAAASREFTRVLLPSTHRGAAGVDWTRHREREMARFDPGFREGMLARQIEQNAEFLSGYAQTGALEVRSFDAPHLGRVIITDRWVFFTPYRRDKHGRASKVYRYMAGGEMYRWFERMFDQLWDPEGA